MVDSVYWIWFQIVFGIGTRSAEIMMNFFESPDIIADGMAGDKRIASMFEENERGRVRGAMEKAKRIKERTLRKGCDIITPDNPLYPASLLEIYSKPAALYVKGDLSCLKESLAIAMVGSRRPTKYGLEAAKYIASGLASEGVVIISGLANGIDAACHESALDAGSKTIGIMGCGMDVDYPKGSSALKRKSCQNGAIVTEYPLGEPPAQFHFPIRNRIISGMARGIVVVEAGEGSGSLITADLAAEQGRDIFAVPGSIFSGSHRGANKLIKEGCKPVTCVMDILEEYEPCINFSPRMHIRYGDPTNNNINSEASEDENEKTAADMPLGGIPDKKKAPGALSAGAALVYERMGREPKSADEVISEVDMGVGAVLSSLTELELYGLIQVYPGRLFGLKCE